MSRSTALIGSFVLAIGLMSVAFAGDSPPVTAAQIAAASSAADHEAIAKAFDDQAADLEAKADWHHTMANAYRTAGKPAIALETGAWYALTKAVKHASAARLSLAA